MSVAPAPARYPPGEPGLTGRSAVAVTPPTGASRARSSAPIAGGASSLARDAVAARSAGLDWLHLFIQPQNTLRMRDDRQREAKEQQVTFAVQSQVHV